MPVPEEIIRRDKVHHGVNLALRGEPDAALTVLLPLADEDASVMFPVAELLAYMGRWDQAAAYATRVIDRHRFKIEAKPETLWQKSGLMLGIVFATLGTVPPMIWLLIKAGEIYGDWPAFRRQNAAAFDTARSLAEEFPYETPYTRFLTEFSDPILTVAPTDLVGPTSFNRDDPKVAYERKKAYRLEHGKTLDADRCDFLEAAVIVDSAEDIVDLYDPTDASISWKTAVAVVRSLVRTGRDADAWDAAQRHMGVWRESQLMSGRHGSSVTPIEFLTRTPLGFMTPERCRAILETPRGESLGRQSASGPYYSIPAKSADPAIEKWQSKIAEISQYRLKADLEKLKLYPADLYETGYFGMPPARETQILQAEERLKVRLPESYRTFLMASNGCHDLSFLRGSGDLLPVEEIHRYDEPIDFKFERQAGEEPELWTSWRTFDVDVAAGIDDLDSALERVMRNAIVIARPSAPERTRRLLLLTPDLTTDGGEWVCLHYGEWMWSFSCFFGYRSFRHYVDGFVEPERNEPG